LDFAKWALSTLGLPSGAKILDPWSGSGTTAAACAALGLTSCNFDLSPVMVILGRARLSSEEDFQSTILVLEELYKGFKSNESVSFETIGARLRCRERTTSAVFSICLAALYPLARELLKDQKTKNPTWYRKDTSLGDVSLSASWLFDRWVGLVNDLDQWSSQTRDLRKAAATRFAEADSRKLPLANASQDGFLTSPPYLTRIDYVHATLPEFLLLEAFCGSQEKRRLRELMIGSPLTTGRFDGGAKIDSLYVNTVLDAVADHSSKASSTYYLSFIKRYFIGLEVSVAEISRTLKSGGRGCIVVQSSHYKEIEIDLTKAVAEIAGSFGLELFLTAEFGSLRSISLVNTRAHEAAKAPKSEFALFFRKE
jgi:hypothetical protein